MIKQGQEKIILANIAIFAFFAPIFIMGEQFPKYVWNFLVVLTAFIIISKTNRRVSYPNLLLWALTIWGGLHLAGGGIFLDDGVVLYRWVIIPIVGNPYDILKYDQLTHAYGFGLVTMALYYIVKAVLQKNKADMKLLLFIVILAGLGVGAINEIFEFLAVSLDLENSIGEYENNMLDLVADLIGAILAIIIIQIHEKRTVK